MNLTLEGFMITQEWVVLDQDSTNTIVHLKDHQENVLVGQFIVRPDGFYDIQRKRIGGFGYYDARIVHPLLESIEHWRTVLSDNEWLQPFIQLDREFPELTEDDIDCIAERFWEIYQSLDDMVIPYFDIEGTLFRLNCLSNMVEFFLNDPEMSSPVIGLSKLNFEFSNRKSFIIQQESKRALRKLDTEWEP